MNDAAALQLVLTDDELFDEAISAEASASGPRWRAADCYAELQARGYSTRQIGERVDKSFSHVAHCLRCVRVYPGTQQRPDFQQAYEKAKGGPGILGSSESNEWYTPAEYVEAVRSVLGAIDVDPASCAEANEIVKAARFYDEAEDGLAQEWTGRIFMNPPYGRSCAAFVAKLIDEYRAGSITEAVLLVSAYSTETEWFQPLFDFLICFPDHRLRGWPNPTFGSAFVYLGTRESAFVAAFDRYGPIVRRENG